MQWNKNDTDQYLQAKEYIDTVVMALIPFQLSNDQELSKLAYQDEVLQIFASEITRELSGRTMQVPAYHYLKSANRESETDRINTWIQDSAKQPFQHTFLLTFDASWKKQERELNGNLLWLPGIQSGGHSLERNKTIHS
ncbi:DUF2487 family protein [Virgibacillus halophilus]|uniref:DUF2487 family protein n=1 Tax=Tigheibacillus halophilus TaxID=361280 RepID=A0ABU5CBE4_9BACI|nr:DUF2487 family protein [Virgibacillus halophilus]